MFSLIKYNIRFKTNAYIPNKKKELLSVSKTNNNIKNMPKYSKCSRVQSYYSRPFSPSFTLQNTKNNGAKRHYYVNPQKPPEDDPILYVMIGLSYLTYRYMNKPKPPPAYF